MKRAFSVARMSEAVKLIVEAHVGLNFREGLQEIRSHRQKVRRSLQKKASGCLQLLQQKHH